MTTKHGCKILRVVGAYAAQPDEIHERSAFLEEVLSLSGVDGLEISWGAPGWERDAPLPADMLGNRGDRGGHVLTLIGAAATIAAKAPSIGLASPDPGGRERAVQLVASAREAALDCLARGQRIVAVALRSFPTLAPAEPRRVSRRPDWLSHAAMATSSVWA